MANPSDLEKMGRELKCPICLSLLNSAVSLPCNHSFCNGCLLKCMKLDLNCPVCKAPFRRREVRAAPNMDNLVGIYKSLEVASGTNIFVSQTVPASLKGIPVATNEQMTVEGSGVSIGKEIVESSPGKLKKRKTKRCRKPRRILKVNASVCKDSKQPSFPAKKRVHVPQCITSETPTRPHKHVPEQIQLTEHIENKNENMQREGSVLKENGEPKLTPFFWLREQNDDADNLESSSYEQRELDEITNDPPQDVPSFSDIKDSYEQSPSKSTSSAKASKFVSEFDSEMFEWTQRACSPEIYTSSTEMEVLRDDELEVVEEDNYKETSHAGPASAGVVAHWEHAVVMDSEDENANPDVVSLSSSEDNVTIDEPSTELCNKGKKRKRRFLGRKSEKKEGEEASPASKEKGTTCQRNKLGEEVPRKSRKKAKSLRQRNKLQTSSSGPDLGKTISCRKRLEASDTMSVHKSVEDTAALEFVDENAKNQESNTTVRGSLIVDRALKKVSKDQSKENYNPNRESLPYYPKVNNVPVNKSDAKLCSSNDKVYTRVKNNSEGMNGRIHFEVSADSTAKTILDEEILKCVPNREVDVDENLNNIQAHCNLEFGSVPALDTGKKLFSVSRDTKLQKCTSISRQFKCAFCHSSTDSESSGDMVHYLNGRSVTADIDVQLPNTIHSHRNCTEWAPNAYFEDDNAINLESEICRSRRIKCCCCGINGAALGCYEKSCRKSFHVPCAKLVLECRWDDENFVMLCPLHASSNLPKENSESQEVRRKKSLIKGSQQKQTDGKTPSILKASQLCKWPESHWKWVLCCSGVTVAEKELVSKLARLAGVLVVKTYNSSVTHVIASTDENGACRRTLKFLMGILEGKWILRIDWVHACIKAMEPVAEEEYEINVDIHGILGGSQLGRLRVLNKQPKLFNGLTFHFIAVFPAVFKMYLQDLVAAAGGVVLQRKPVSVSMSGTSTFIIYNDECDSHDKSLCRNKAEELAHITGAEIASHKWLLDSIAACKLQTLAK